jgi:hypothetical protein
MRTLELRRIFFIGLVIFFAHLTSLSAQSPTIGWIRQVGSARVDYGRGVAADSLGNIAFGGWALGSLSDPNVGTWSSFTASYSSSGNQQWTQQTFPPFNSVIQTEGVALDGLGNTYNVGLATNANTAGDGFVEKHNSSGAVVWTRFFSTPNGDGANGVQADKFGNVFVCGGTFGTLGSSSFGGGDTFVCKLNSTGNLLWTTQLGSSLLEDAFGISIDTAGNSYVCGRKEELTNNGNSTYKNFVTKLDPSGTALWTTQIGGQAGIAYSISADSLGNIFVSGNFISKLNSNGDLMWSKQFVGPNEVNDKVKVAADGKGNVYVAGDVNLVHDQGSRLYPFGDPVIQKYDTNGNLLWDFTFSSGSPDYLNAIAADGMGNIYGTGYTLGSFGGPNVGGEDAFLIKIVEVPEPSTYLLVALVSLGVVFRFRHRSAIQLRTLRN